VEDDPATRDILVRGLREERVQVEAVSDGAEAESRVAATAFDVIVLDVILPGNDGFATCRRLRAHGVDTPVLLLTGRQAIADRVRGLDSGADDYLGKPFAAEELLARLRALARRGRTRHLQAVLACGPIEFDQRDQVVRVDGEPVQLSATELRLLEYFLGRPNVLVTRDALARHLWGHLLENRSNVIDVYVSYLRRRLTPRAAAMLRTVRGLGYTLTSEQG
jgi:DNA-binding response OmpR family regulator